MVTEKHPKLQIKSHITSEKLQNAVEIAKTDTSQNDTKKSLMIPQKIQEKRPSQSLLNFTRPVDNTLKDK